MKPLVSILIPAYNAGPWIKDAIESALGQTWTKKEIIVVDDGSKDASLAVARSFESRGVQVIAQENQGASAARNKALSICQGEYIQWLDADDILVSDKIEEQLKVADNLSRRHLLSSSWGKYYYRLSKARFNKNSLWQDLTPVEWISRKMADNAWMAIESWLSSRELVKAAGPWDTSLSMDDDGEYFDRVVAASAGVVFVPAAKTYVRQANLGSLSKSIFSREKLESQFHSMSIQIRNVLKLENSQRVRLACVQYLQTWFIYFYPEHENIVRDARALATELGGTLEAPELSWKYSVLQKFVGLTNAKRLAFTAPKAKAWCVKGWDRFLFDFAGAR